MIGDQILLLNPQIKKKINHKFKTKIYYDFYSIILLFLLTFSTTTKTVIPNELISTIVRNPEIEPAPVSEGATTSTIILLVANVIL